MTPAQSGRPAADRSTVELVRWSGRWEPADPYAGLKSDVVAYGHLDPLTTLQGLSDASGVPVGALVHYVLARWASGGNEAVLELGVSGVDHLVRIIDAAEAAGTDAARLEAYTSVREVVRWLRGVPVDTGGEDRSS
jgi:hypothetical protein